MNTSSGYLVTRATTGSRAGIILAIVGLVLLASVPLWAGRDDMRFIVEISYMLALAQMWNLLAGYAGLVSAGQQAYVGFGGYALFVGAMYLGLPPIAALPLAGIAAAIVALPVALLIFRLRGAYFAIGTWVVAEVFRLGFAQSSTLGGGSGQSLPAQVVRGIASDRASREMVIYYTGVLLAVATLALVYMILRSRHGLALTALRDSEPASESVGVDNFRTKLLVYVITAFATSAIGALIFLQKLRISPDAGFSMSWTTDVIFIVIIGGIGTIEGPLLGALVFFALRALLADYGSLYLIMLGTSAVVVMLKARQGLWGLIAERYDIHLFPVKRRLHLTNRTPE